MPRRTGPFLTSGTCIACRFSTLDAWYFENDEDEVTMMLYKCRNCGEMWNETPGQKR